MMKSRVIQVISGISLLVIWFLVANLIDFPFPSLEQGWNAPIYGFLFGFMLIPKVVGFALILGVEHFPRVLTWFTH